MHATLLRAILCGHRFQASFGLVVTGFRSHQQKNDHLVDHQRTPNKEPLAPTSPWGKIPTNPVNPGLGQRAEADSDVFSSILKEEEKQLQTRHRVTSKSLHLVQVRIHSIFIALAILFIHNIIIIYYYYYHYMLLFRIHYDNLFSWKNEP